MGDDASHPPTGAKEAGPAPAPRVVDARGHRCPTPTLRLRRALAAAAAGETVLLLADDPLARIDVPHFAAELGHRVLEVSQDGATLRFAVRKAGAA